jgi:hypothetical protein
VIGLVTSGLLARMLLTPEFGAYSLILSVISLQALVGSLGLPKTVVRFIAENLALGQFGRTRRVIYTVLGIGVLGTLDVRLAYLPVLGDLVVLYDFDSLALVAVAGLTAGWLVISGVQKVTAETFRKSHDIRWVTLLGVLGTGSTRKPGNLYRDAALGDKRRAAACHRRVVQPGQDGLAGAYAAQLQHLVRRPLPVVPEDLHAPGRPNTGAGLRRLLQARCGDTHTPERREDRGCVLRVLWAGAPDDRLPQADPAGQQADPPAFYDRSSAGGVRLRTYGGRGGGRNHRTAKRDHGADRQEAGRDVDPRELLPLVVPEGSLEPISDPQRGGAFPVFQRLASRGSAEDVGQEVRRGETLG